MGAAALVLADNHEIAVVEKAAPVVNTDQLCVKKRDYQEHELTANQRQRRNERLRFCMTVVETAKRTQRSHPECCDLIAATEHFKYPLLSRGRGKNGKSLLTHFNFRTWIQLLGKKSDGTYDWDNKNALVDNYVNCQREKDGEPEVWKFFFAFYLQPQRWSVKMALKKAAKEVRKNNPFAFIPSPRQARYRLSKMDRGVIARGRIGEEEVKNKFVMYIDRDWNDATVNEMWESDHRVLDCLVQCRVNGKLVAKRPWICAVMDAKSKYVISYRIQIGNPDNDTIRDVTAMAIIINNFRTPEYFLSDNGLDFKAQGFAYPVTVDGHEHCTFRMIDIIPTTSNPYNGRAKTCERRFLEDAVNFDKTMPGYLGNKPDNRPANADIYYDQPHLLPTIEEFTQKFAVWIDEYHRKPSDSKALNGMSPLEMWQARQDQGRQWSRQELFNAFLAPLPETRTVDRGGMIKVNNKLYQNRLLVTMVRKKVMVKIDRFNPEHVYAFETNGKLICECETKKSVRARVRTDYERALLAENMKEQRRQEKYFTDELDRLTGGMYKLPVSEIENLKPGEKIVKVAQKNKVKAQCHNNKIYLPESRAAELRAPEPLPAPEPDNDDLWDDKEKADQEFHEHLISVLKNSAEPGAGESAENVDLDVSNLDKINQTEAKHEEIDLTNWK